MRFFGKFVCENGLTKVEMSKMYPFNYEVKFYEMEMFQQPIYFFEH